jgi:hypothetical protein
MIKARFNGITISISPLLAHQLRQYLLERRSEEFVILEMLLELLLSAVHLFQQLVEVMDEQSVPFLTIRQYLAYLVEIEQAADVIGQYS